jgi:hypothetical protein
MADRRENSVLFSLKELRRIEDDRVRKEQEEVRAHAEAERAAREAAERARRDEAERLRREEEERLRRQEEEKETRHRDDQMRLQEAERRARVEGEMRIQQERMRLEVQARAKHSPVKAVLSVALVLVLLGGGLTWKMYTQHQRELAAQQMVIEAARADAKKAQAEFEARMAAIQKEMNDKLANARSEEERERIRSEAAQAKAQVQAARSNRVSHASSAAKADKDAAGTSPKWRNPGKHEISDNPIEGL